MMILGIFCLLGFVQHVGSIKCYTCTLPDFYCSLPLNLDGGEDHNENDIGSFNYDFGYICQSEQVFDPQTGMEKIILRGVEICEGLDVYNHRVYCCDTDNCNKQLPPMRIQTVIYSSNGQRFLPSIILIVFAVIILQCFY